MVDLCPVFKWSGFQMVIWKPDWKSLFMVHNGGFLNGLPSHMILTFEYRTPILSGIQMNPVFKCSVIRWFLFNVSINNCRCNIWNQWRQTYNLLCIKIKLVIIEKTCIQSGLEFRTFEFRIHSKTERLKVQISNGSVFEPPFKNRTIQTGRFSLDRFIYKHNFYYYR